jgi:hypothetical protein
MDAVAAGHEGAGTRTVPRVDVDRLFFFAFLMTAGCREDALQAVRMTLNDVPSGGLEAIGALARRVEGESGRQAEGSFGDLEDTLGYETTRTLELDEGEDQLHLHWLMHRTCLMRALDCLPAKLRSVYVLTALFQCSLQTIATLLAVTPTQVNTRLFRAEKRLAAFFGPRCEHLDADNPCKCLGRLSVLIDGDFLPLASPDQFPVAPVNRGRRELRVIYSDLPRPRLSREEQAELSQLGAAVGDYRRLLAVADQQLGGPPGSAVLSGGPHAD